MNYNKWLEKLRFLNFNVLDFVDTMQHIDIEELTEFLREAEKNGKTKADICNDFVNYISPAEESQSLNDMLENENISLDEPKVATVETPKQTLEDILTENNIQIG